MGRMGKRKTPKPRKPRALSLCSGIGGIDLAVEWAGFEIVGQCEIDPFCQQVLAKHWPDVKRAADIRDVWGDTFDGSIQLLVAGFPCPPVSVAGKRGGAADPRWLWPEVLRVIQIYEPTWVVLENVAGLISLGLDDVLADLDAAGYESWTVVFPAAAVGAPHPRERVFIVAHADSSSGRGVSHEVAGATGRRSDDAETSADGSGQDVADAAGGARCGAAFWNSGLTLAGNTGHGWPAQSRMGGDADGTPRRLDGAPRHAWPAWRGEAQHEWEPPRTTTERIPNRAKRLTALGNAVVPQQVYPILTAIAAMLAEEPAEPADEGVSA